MPAGRRPAGDVATCLTAYGVNEMIKVIFALNTSKFPLGQMVITANASSQLDHAVVHDALRRHASGDWGDIPPEDATQNEFGLKHGERLFSAYGKGEKRFWIITERDRSVTTVLLPEDY
jgi:hypothetical protein